MILKTSIIIINYYSEDLVISCIDSIFKFNNQKELEVIVVDNGSTTLRLESLNYENLIVLKNKENKGFGFACNQGMKKANGDYLLFLNPDTKVFKDSISKALLKLQNSPEITVLGCKQIDEFNTVHRSCARYLTLGNYLSKTFRLNKLLPSVFKSFHMDNWDHASSQFVDHVIGAFYLIRKQDFLNVNGFDEDYFVYFEDLDLSKRLTDKGGRIFYDADIEIFHQGGGTSKKVKAKRLFYSLDATLIYAKKHFSTLNYIILNVFVLFVEPFIRMIFSLLSNQRKSISQIVKAYGMLYTKRFKL